MGFGLGLGLGFSVNGGAIDSAVNPVLPQAASIVRAYSIRRLIPAFGNAINGYADNDTPIGGTPSNGFSLPFTSDGTVSMAGSPNLAQPAYMYELYDQKGNNGTPADRKSELVQGTFTSCPEVFNTTLNKGLKFDGGDILTMGGNDSDLIGALTGNCSILVFFNKSVATSEKIFQVAYNDSGTFLVQTMATGEIRVYARNGSSRVGDIPSTVNYSDGNWHCIGITVNNGGLTKVYFDGSIRFSAATKTVTTGTFPLAIGGGGNVASFVGSINDLIFWSGELSGDDMLAAYNALKTYYPASGAK